jgi:hypothetical protein
MNLNNLPIVFVYRLIALLVDVQTNSLYSPYLPSIEAPRCLILNTPEESNARY